MELSSIVESTENFKLGSDKYRLVILQADNEKLTLPVTPSKYSISTDQNNRAVDILDFGEMLHFGNVKLKRIKFGCFFPATYHSYSFVVGDKKEPSECVDLVTKWKEAKTPIRLIITDSPVNLMVAIDSFDFKEKDGSRDIYYNLELSEYRQVNITPSNYNKTSEELTGLKARGGTATSSLISKWVNDASDIFDKSKFAYGNFSSLDTFKSKNSISRIGDFKISWSW